jgi:Flp pilus assembly protein TadB
VSAPRSARRKRTRLWFVFYTAVLLAIAGVGIVTRQWSVAVTTLAVAAVFALFTRGMWRRR